MKKFSKIAVITICFIILFHVKVMAHGGNITGWKYKNSPEITEYNGKYYGYHKENGQRHYHQVKWDEENKKWIIVNQAVYYNDKFEIINNNSNEKSEKITVTYYSSVDGDTAKFKMNNEIITVRFLGIDTPETVHTQKEEQPYGKEASNHTKEKLENAKEIKIEYDSKASKEDKYGRKLAWIWVDDQLLQQELVSNGLARTYMLQNNYKYADVLQLAEEKAKENKLNIWSENLADNNKEIVEDLDNSKEKIAIPIILAIILIVIRIILLTNKKRKK